MIIATIDNRHPITIALAYAFKTEKVTPLREASLRKELQDMVAESAKKFVGFKNIESVRKALDITLGILSLAVVHSTKGEDDPEKWAELVLQNGLKSLVGGVIQLVKGIANTPDEAEIEPKGMVSGLSAREYLLMFAICRDSGRSAKWNGYGEMCKYLTSREMQRLESDLARWFIQSEVKQSIAGWLEVNKEKIEFGGSERSVSPGVGVAINNLLFRYCGGLTLKGECILKAKDFRSVFAAYKADKKEWISKAKKRYLELTERIPEDLRTPLIFDGRDWFTRFLAKGPPAVPKKAEVLDSISGNVQGYHVEMFA